MIEKLKQNLVKKEYIPFYFFAVLQIIFHIIMREGPGSDAMFFFRNQLKTYTLQEYLTDRYYGWSSRLIVETLLCYVSQNIILWKILDWFMWMLLAGSLVYMLHGKKNQVQIRWMVVGMLLIYPLKDFSTAGWIATTMNYTWPLALGLFCMTGIVKSYRNEKNHWWLILLHVSAALYATNVEQMCAVMLGIYTLSIMYFCIKKRNLREWWSIILIWLISIMEFIFIMTCPGNAKRSLLETKFRLPNYITYNLIDKIELGFVDTLRHMISSDNIIFLLFTILLTTLVFLKTKDFMGRFISLIPLVWTVMFMFFSDVFTKNFEKLSTIMSNNLIINGYNYQLGYSYLPIILYFLILLCILVCLTLISGSWMEFGGYFFLLAIGLASRVVMGFSPTLYVSQERTFLYLYMTIIVMILFMFEKNIKYFKPYPKMMYVAKLSGACILLFGIFNNLMAASAI